MSSTQDQYDELACYTLTHADPAFIHQHIVDAYAAQTADDRTKPIKILFALVGLYLHLERGYTGKQVQLAHMKIAQRKTSYPTITLPLDRGAITVAHVLAIPPGLARDKQIDIWCESVWSAYHESHSVVTDYLVDHLYG